MITVAPNAACCPGCGMASGSVKERTVTSRREISATVRDNGSAVEQKPLPLMQRDRLATQLHRGGLRTPAPSPTPPASRNWPSPHHHWCRIVWSQQSSFRSSATFPARLTPGELGTKVPDTPDNNIPPATLPPLPTERLSSVWTTSRGAVQSGYHAEVWVSTASLALEGYFNSGWDVLTGRDCAGGLLAKAEVDTMASEAKWLIDRTEWSLGSG